MPVKKNSKKNAESKKSKSKPEKKLKKNINKKVEKKNIVNKKTDKGILDIRRAVKDLPSVLAREMNANKNILEKDEDVKVAIFREKIVPVKNRTVEIYEPPKNSKTWLWSAVVIFTIIIFALWIFNISNVFYDSRNSKNVTLDSLKNSKEELQNIFNTFNSETVSTTIKNIEESENIITVTTSTTSSTINIENKLQDVMKELFENSTTTKNNLTTTTQN